MSKSIGVWTAPPREVEVRGGRIPDAVLNKIDVETLKANLQSLARDIDACMPDAETKGGFRLSEIEVGVEVSAEGGDNLIGTMTVGGKAALTLTFRRD